MSREIDERIVQMQFNNNDFESGIKTSLSSIDNLKHSLSNMEGAKGFDEVSSSATKLGWDFDALQVIAVTALVKITDAMIDFGINAAKFLVLDQFTAGFTKYEQQIEAVQTIMNATGKGIEEVTGYMDQLMWFTDETSYRYMDMVRNIGKFTSAGVELSVATEAMQGISVWAALSGKGIQGAETAMEALSVSIGKGAVKLQEWRRLEQANMGTMEFKQVVLDSAVALGTLTKKGENYIAKYVDPLSGKIKPMEVSLTDFGTALKAGWFNSEVLLESLGKYGAYSSIVSQATEEMGITAIEAMARIDAYAEGGSEALKELGELSEEVKTQIDGMAYTTFELGNKAFKAAQQAKSLTDVINFLGDAISTGWMQTFDTVIGNFDEAVEMWSELAEVLYDVFVESGNVRNEMLSLWKEMGGRDVLLEGITNIGRSLLSIIEAIGAAWEQIFPPMAAERLLEITESFRNFTERLLIGEETSVNLTRIFAGLFAALDLVRMVVSTVFEVFGNLIGIFVPVGGGILGVVAGLGDLIVAFRDIIKESAIFEKAVEAIGKVLGVVAYAINEAWKKIVEVFQWAAGIITPIAEKVRDALSEVFNSASFANAVEIMSGLLMKAKEAIDKAADGIKVAIDRLKNFFSQFGDIDLNPLKRFSVDTEAAFAPFVAIGDFLKKAWEKIVGVFTWIVETIPPLIGKIKNALGGFLDFLGEAFSKGDMTTVLAVLDSVLVSGILAALMQFMKILKDLTKDAGSIMKSITGILDAVRDSLKAYQTTLKAKALKDIGIAVGILAASLLVLSTLDGPTMAKSLAGISVLFADLAGIMLVLSKNMGTVDLVGVASKMIAISAAVLILSAALKNIADLDTDALIRGIVGIGSLTAILVQVFKTLSNNSTELTSGAGALVVFAAAVLVLSSAVKVLAGIDLLSLVSGLGGLGVIMVELGLFTKYADPKKLQETGGSILLMSISLNALVAVVKTMGKMDFEALVKGLSGLGIMLLELGIFTKLVDARKLEDTKNSLIALSLALKIMASVVKDFGSMDFEQLRQGLGGLGVVLVELALFTKLADPEKLQKTGASMLALSASLVVISAAMKLFGGMSWEELAKGLVSLSVALGAMAIASKVMEGTTEGAASMLIMAAAILVLSPALKILGGMSLAQIGTALIALAGAFVVLGVAGAVLSPLAPIILTLSGSIALLGVGVLAIGVGLVAFAAGLAALSVGATAGTAAIVFLFSSIIGLIPVAAEALGKGLVIFVKSVGDAFVSLAQAIGVGAPMIASAMGTFISEILQVLMDLAPQFVEIMFTFLENILNAFVVYTPQILDTVFNFLERLLDSFLAYAPKLIAAGVQIILNLLDGILSSIGKITATALQIMSEFLKGIAAGIPGIITSAVDIVVAFINTLAEQTVRLVDAGFKMIINFLNGLADAIRENTPLLIDAIANLALAIIEGLTGGIAAGVTRVVNTVKELAVSLIDGFKNMLGINSPSKVFDSLGDNIVVGLINGIISRVSEAVNAIKNLGSSLISGFQNAIDAHSPSRVFQKLGGYIDDGVISGISDGAKDAKKASENLGSGIIDAFKEVMGIHSPSEEFKKLGNYTVQGWVAGEEEESAEAEKAAREFANGVIRAAYEAFDVSGGSSKIFESLGVANAQGLITGINKMGAGIKAALSRTFAGKENEETLKNITGIVDEALTTIESRLTTYTDIATDRFSRINRETETSVQDMIDNLKYNQLAIVEWTENIGILIERGLNDGLIEELRNAGPNSAAEVKALVEASDEQIQELNTVMEAGGAVATQALVASVAEGQPYMGLEGQALVNAMAGGLSEATTVGEAMSLILAQAQQIGTESALNFESLGSQITDAMQTGMEAGTQGMVDALIQALEGIETEVLPAAEKAGGGAGGGVKKGAKDELTDEDFISDPIEAELTVAEARGTEKGEQTGASIATSVITGLEGKKGVFGKVGSDFGIGFSDYLKSTSVDADKSAKHVGTAAIAGLKSNVDEYATAGKTFGKDFATNLMNTDTDANTAGTTVTTKALDGITSNTPEYGNAGKIDGTDFSNNLESTAPIANTAGVDVTAKALEGISSNVDEYKQAGVNAAQGFIDGIDSMVEKAAEIARKLARAAREAIEDELDEHSPSRVFYRIGSFTGEGFVNGLDSMTDKVASSATNMGSTAIDRIKQAIATITDTIEQDLDLSPTITPVVNLSEVQNGMDLLRRTMAKEDLSPTANNANRISALMSGTTSTANAVGSQATTATGMSFVQNNYSPKALTRLEIYRQTKNQFAQLKGLIEGV